MPTLPSQSIDAIICDLPYGTTACAWDSVIPFAPLWAEYKRLIKPRGAIVLFGSQPFTSALIMSNLEWFKYCWVWDKACKGGFLHAANMPLKQHEDIVVFSGGIIEHASKTAMRMTYNPQMSKGASYIKNSIRDDKSEHRLFRPSMNKDRLCVNNGERFPSSILSISNADQNGKFHPTQKPLDLLQYLVKTYTNPGDTVMDNCFGSGTTGVACKMLHRNFVGIEKDPDYFAIAARRIEDAQAPMLTEEGVFLQPEQQPLFES